MPGLGRLLSVAEAFKPASVSVDAGRCTRRRRASTCAACLEVCPTGAISVSRDGPVADALSCSTCGACAAVCPTGALEPLRPSDPTLVAKIVTAATSGTAVTIACAQAPAPGAEAVTVTCLARLEPSLVLRAFAAGAADVTLATGVCAACSLEDAALRVPVVAAGTQRFIDAFALAGRLRLVQGQEAPAAGDAGRDPGAGEQAGPARTTRASGVTRRGFFDVLRKGGMISAATAAGILSEAEAPEEDPRLEVPTRLPAKRERLLEALRALLPEGSPQRRTTAAFLAPEVERTRCIGCAVCGRVCPTGALEVEEDDKGALRILGHDEACTECGLCLEICREEALSLAPISAERVLARDAEPRTLYERSESESKPVRATFENKLKDLLGVPVYRT